MASPYDNLPPHAFWRDGVVNSAPTAMSSLYHPKFTVTKETKIMTAGSCFAQHVHRNLRARGWSAVETETLVYDLPEDIAATFGYGLYSARYGNIYSVRQMLQLVREAYGDFVPAAGVWEKSGRFFEAQRPSVEPEGLASAAYVLEARADHLSSVRKAIAQADMFVFTLGLTETWLHHPSGTVFPTAPGVIAGDYDSETFVFHNSAHDEITADLQALRDILKALNPDMSMLLTVSPVPLTATATGTHVLAASTYSKAVLRAAAGAFADAHNDVDYFPSFEVITNPAARSGFYKPNLRSVEDDGVAAAMQLFFAAHDPDGTQSLTPQVAEQADANDELICEEAMLEAFRGGARRGTVGGNS